MNDHNEKSPHITEQSDPTHFVSIFPSWLSRAEWEAKGFPSAPKNEQKKRLERRVNLSEKISIISNGGLNEIYNPIVNFSATEAAETYLQGGPGRIFTCFDDSVFVQPWYLRDDADSLWVYSEKALTTIKDIAKDLGLFIIEPANQARVDNSVRASLRATS